MSGCNTIINQMGIRTFGSLRARCDGMESARIAALTCNIQGKGTTAHYSPRAFAAVDFFWFRDAWNPEDPSLISRTQTLL